MRSASSARWPRASSNISPRAPGPSACTPAGRRNRACARRCWRAPASPGRARCSRARTASSTASPTPRRATSTRSTGDFGTRWLTQTLAFKLYPCGTMTHPYIDCARRLGARGIKPDDVVEMVCDVGEGTVHRLWEPLAAQADAEQRLRRKILAALLHRGGLHPRQCGLERFLRRGGEGAGGRGARQEGPLPHRPRQSLSRQLHRPHPRDACATAA